ncbi:MAG: hypothetical protein ACRD10_02395 [Terriglobia bacterium]
MMIRRWGTLLLFAGLLCVSMPVHSQENPPQTGSPAQAGPPSVPLQGVGTPEPSSPASNSQLQPDTHSLTGPFLYTLGSVGEGRSYIEPAFSISEAAQTNASYLPNAKANYSGVTVPMAQVSLVHLSRRNQFNAGYTGGAFLYDNGGVPTSSFHELDVTDAVLFKRWRISITDVFSYLPNGGFGFGGIGALGGLTAGVPSGLGVGAIGGAVNPMYTPNQSILTSQLGAYNNATVAEAVYSLTARTSISAGGSYGTLQSGNKQTSFVSGNNVMGFAGLQRYLTARDDLGVMYNYETFNYVGLASSFRAQVLNLAYGRKITGRLALQLYGGPELVSYRLGAAPLFTHTSATGTVSLTYLSGRNTFGMFVSHYATGGSGVYAGSNTTMISGDWSRQLTQRWSGTVYGGYSRNTQLAAVGTSLAGHYNSWFATAIFSRNLGRYLSLRLDYEYQRQAASSGTCTPAFCAGSLVSEIFGAGITFRPRPIGL